MTSATVLARNDAPPFIVENEGAPSRFLLICDHAGCRVPPSLDDLGLPRAELERHIGWDLGAAALTRALAVRLAATAVLQPWSRLVVDCNRAPDRADAVPAVSDGTAIPGNEVLSPEARAARLAAVHAPYHAAIAGVLDRRAGRETALVLVHSFTPALRTGGGPRPWHAGVLHAGQPLALAVLSALRAEPDLIVGENEPYAFDGTDYTAARHGTAQGIDFVELEIRQDLLADDAGVAAWAERLARALTST